MQEIMSFSDRLKVQSFLDNVDTTQSYVAEAVIQARTILVEQATSQIRLIDRGREVIAEIEAILSESNNG